MWLFNSPPTTIAMAILQDESAGSLSTGSGLELDEGEEVLGSEELREDDNVQLGSDDDF